MKGKSNVNNSIQSKLLVETFEINWENETIICEGYDENNSQSDDCEFEIEVAFNDFEKWLDDNEFLKGSDEQCHGTDHTGEPKFYTQCWDYTFEDCLDGTADWKMDQCLTQFINQTKKFKELSK